NVVDNSLVIEGTAHNDRIAVTVMHSPSTVFMYVAMNGEKMPVWMAPTPLRRIMINGHAGDDVISVTSDQTETIRISADGGNDYVHVTNGNSHIYGGDGDDTLMGGADGDAIRGGPGNDLMTGGDWKDMMYGEDGNDTMLGNGGQDRMWGG